MGNNKAGKFRGSWMFDTHEATYHLDDDNQIVGLQCSKVQKEIIGIQTNTTVSGYIGNPGVFALSESPDTDILKELTQTYSTRVEKWLQESGTKKEELSQAA